MSRIFLTTSPEALDIPRDGTALWLYADDACRPDVPRAISLSRFMSDPHGATRDADVLVVHGLVSRITTPANRVRTGQFLTDPWPSGPPRLSVDDKLFIVDPWRMWWHWGCVGADFGGLHTSYRAESLWRASLEGRATNPVTLEAAVKYGTGVIRACNPFRFDFHAQILPMSTSVHDEYAAEKERAFTSEHTITAILKRLSAFASRVCPDRRVPSFREMFSARRLHVVATDLGVDRWLLAQIEERVRIINGVAEAFA